MTSGGAASNNTVVISAADTGTNSSSNDATMALTSGMFSESISLIMLVASTATLCIDAMSHGVTISSISWSVPYATHGMTLTLVVSLVHIVSCVDVSASAVLGGVSACASSPARTTAPLPSVGMITAPRAGAATTEMPPVNTTTDAMVLGSAFRSSATLCTCCGVEHSRRRHSLTSARPKNERERSGSCACSLEMKTSMNVPGTTGVRSQSNVPK